MKKSEKEIAEEVATLSHELRSPLTSIAGFVDGILDGTIPEKDYMHYLRIVSGEVKRLTEITSKMLDNSKIELLDAPASLQKFPLNESVIRIFCTFEKIIEGKNITIEGLSEDNPVTVTGDLGLITQALYNLIENAVKYTNVNGCISVSFSSENGFSVFSIRNTGAGISDDEKEKIFSKFYRSESAKKNQPDGTGLGLSITKAVVNLHNGTIYADGIPDGFAEFTVKLPS